MSRRLRVAVIGVGGWGINHVRVLSRLTKTYDIEVIVVDALRERARQVAEKYGVKSYYADYLEAYRKEKYDAAIVAVPTKLHYHVARDLIDKADLLIEKPLATTIRDAAEIVKMAERNNRIVAVGHIERFNPAVIAAKKEIETRVKEDPVLAIYAERIGIRPTNVEKYLGVALDLMVHDIDVVCYLLNELPESVQALKYPPKGFEDDALAVFSFENKNAILHASRRARMKRRNLRIQTLYTLIEVDYMLQHIKIIEGIHPSTTPPDYFKILEAYQSSKMVEKRLLRGAETEPLFLEDKHFVEAVIEGKRPLVSAVEGYISVKCALKAIEAAEREIRVHLKWDEDFLG
ncbi:MAG: Gfo/Idh/MocA family oxidoreductase [Thermoproteales archaeon]|nr:Gfo/Idh/MocA family oxidoreductase [Thermoproteales archaeon]